MIIWLYLIYIYNVGINIIGFWQNIIIWCQKKKKDLAMEIIFNVTITNCSIKKKN